MSVPPASLPFPLVGVLTPLVLGFGLWAFTGSAFALVGSVLGPAMVLAHYGDGIRRTRREERTRIRRETREAETRGRERLAGLEAERRTANRIHPCIAHIVDDAGWKPPLDGRTTVRAGSEVRDGVGGFPWLVDVANGVAVVGDGRAAESVWRSLLVHASAAAGTVGDAVDHATWSTGAWIHRGDHDTAGLSIRCSGGEVESVTRRGSLPERGDWSPDDSTHWLRVLTRCQSGDGPVFWNARKECPDGIGLADGRPFRLDLTSETPHVLVCGRTGTGKSEFLAALLCDWAERFEPARLSWVGIDFKGGATLTPLADLPHCRGIVTDLDGDGVRRVLASLPAELLDRERELALEGVQRVDDSRSLGRLVIVIDEFPELIRQFPEALDVLANVARRGRSLGVHLVVTTQSMNVVHRDGLAANIAVRVCFPMASEHDVTSALGEKARVPPGIGQPVVALGDGRQLRVTVRCGARPADTRAITGTRLESPWLPPLQPPIAGTTGFGRIDDVVRRTQPPARWTPADGDVLIVGRRGSGRSTAARSLVGDRGAAWVRTIEDLANARGLVVIDDLDRMVDELPDSRKHELPSVLSSRRLDVDPPRFILSVVSWSPRLHGLPPNVLVLATPNRDAHLAAGEPLETFDPSAQPGVGSWKGQRVVVYDRTESTVTEGRP